MNSPQKSSDDGHTQNGLIALFDILGYKSVVKNNDLTKTISILSQIEEAIEHAAKRLEHNQSFVGAKVCEHVVFSDSILVYAVPSTSDLQEFTKKPEHMQAALIAEFSADLLNRLLLAGLPVRGAWAYGRSYIDTQTPGKIVLAGMPIVEAYEWSNSLDMSGCLLAPSAEAYLAENGILDTSSETPMGFIKYLVPMNLNRGRQKQLLFMLNQGSFYKNYRQHYQGPEISRQMIMEKFAAHNKQIDVDQIPKANNTLEFLQTSN